MKLRNKKTGEIIEVNGGRAYIHFGELAYMFNTLKQLNENWEDYNE